MYRKNPYCPICGVFMVLPMDVPKSGDRQLAPDNMCTYEHIFNKNEPSRKFNKSCNRILCRKCNNGLGGENAARIAEEEKNSVMDLQKVDCNCNDCFFMQRDVERFKESLSTHLQWGLNHFYTVKNNLLKKADNWNKRGFPKKAAPLTIEANKMKFQFDKKEVAIHYGNCKKRNEPVSFIPNILQLETRECFSHRREN